MRTLREIQDKEFDALLTPAQREARVAQKSRHGRRGMHDRQDRDDARRGNYGPREQAPAAKPEKPAA